MMKTGRKAKRGSAAPESTPNAADLAGPSPNPATNLLIAELALRGGAVLMRQGLERGLLRQRYAPKKAAKILKGRTMGQTLLHTALARIAISSVPGAILVGGGLLAKTLYDRRRGQAARTDGENRLEAMAEAGRDGDDEAAVLPERETRS